MFLRSKIRRKDGKEHRAWSVVENRRAHDGRVVQRQVLYLGEINHSQKAAWSKAIEVFDEGAGQPKQIALFPEDRVAPALDCDVVSIRLSEMRLRRPRQWGACWMATLLWDQLRLDEFWFAALPPSREGTNWLNILKTLVGYQLISPGSEWRLHRHWFEHSAMGDLLGEDLALVQPNNLYRCLDKLTAHKQAMFTFLKSDDPGYLWRLYLQLVEVEQAFKELKNDLSIRPIYHQLETRIEAHIFIAFLAYCLFVTLKLRLKTLAPGLTPRAVLEKLAAMQMIDVELSTTDDRVVVLSRYTEPG